MTCHTRMGSLSLMFLWAAILSLCGCADSEPTGIVVCLGDSLTVCGGPGGQYVDWLKQAFPDVMFFNQGINGDTLEGGRRRFERDVLQAGADVVIIELGANDFLQATRPISNLRDDLEDMVRRAKNANIEVVIASCFGPGEHTDQELQLYGVDKGTLADAIWQMEQAIAKQYDCFYVPNMQDDIKPNGADGYWADSNHPNKAGNQFVAQRIAPALRKALNRASARQD